MDVKLSTYIDFSKEANDENTTFRMCDIVRIWKYKNIFSKNFDPNWSQEIFVIKKVKKAVPLTHIISDLKREEIDQTFYGKELKKKTKQNQQNERNQIEFIVAKVIKKKSD